MLAIYWYRRAADAGHAGAQYNLARCFERGWGCRKSPAMAVKYYRMAMAQKLPQAVLRYAELLYKGVSAEKSEHGEFPALEADKAGALQLMRRAAETSPQGRLLLVKYLFKDAPKHGNELRRLLAGYCQKADVHTEALVLYASCLRAGIGGKVDIPLSVAMLNRAEQRGNMEAVAQLAELYMLGIGVPHDMKKSLSMTRRAARSGNQRALVNLGNALISGIGVEYDPAKAVDCFSRAGSSGYPPALRKLGECYARGIGVAQDWQKAVDNYRAAAEGGDDEALFVMGELYDRGVSGIIRSNLTTAFYYYSRSADAGSIKAMRRMAVALLDGRGVQKNTERGMALLRTAAGAGDQAAQFILSSKTD